MDNSKKRLVSRIKDKFDTIPRIKNKENLELPVKRHLFYLIKVCGDGGKVGVGKGYFANKLKG
ncbi:hypothetical protein [Desulfosporosinus sp. BG]|uniref:hypothetical protein n=1 Tax=Desulfosporosinus sp. BG TaxID=1633135 RepID=UPI00083AF60E|nr:hypothetical protein [Desulfosporosinus sp. BG]ODA39555.1 hypothetical protein DSBG_3670 [Desulfosporosinus sp. BG]